MADIFITRRILDDGLDLLKGHNVTINEGDNPPSKDVILSGIRDKDALICLLTDPIDSDVIRATDSLKIIANYAVGYDNIDIKEATQKGIVVTNTPGVLTETVADLTWALLMSIARKIVEGNQFMHNNLFTGWAPLLMIGSDVYNKTLGIVGAGRIGTAVARRAKGFNMKILYYSRRHNHEVEKECNARLATFEEILQESDYLSLHTPLNETSYHIIGEDELKLMKPSSYLINTGRGKCIDEKALVKSLKDGTIKGAALDVFEYEPKVTKELFSLKNVILTPHVGSASFETRSKMAKMVAKNVLAALDGVIPPNCVNPEAWNNKK